MLGLFSGRESKEVEREEQPSGNDMTLSYSHGTVIGNLAVVYYGDI